MSPERTAVRTPAVAHRRTAAPATVQRSAALAVHEPATRATQRAASQAAPTMIARALAGPTANSPTPSAPVHVVAIAGTPGTPQLLAKVSSPGDPAELEAEQVARNVVKMGVPLSTPRVDDKAHHEMVHRSADPAAGSPHPAPVDIGVTGGAPLPAGVRSFMEPRFGADFGNVRVHTGEAAAQQSAALHAHAFTVGQHIFFGRGQFQPESAHGKELMAHELTHTVQQGASVQHGVTVHRSADTTVTQRSEPRVQRLGIGDALNTIADKANYIPGFRLFTIVLGVNPINQAPVERSAANILRALLEMIPVTGALIAQALENHGIFAKVGTWVEAQVRSLGMVGSAFKQALDKFLDSLNWRDIFDLGGVWERAKRIFTEPIDRLISFGKNLATDILRFIRDAILLPLAKLAEGTRGYDLLKAVLGQDPISGQPCPRTADTLIGGFMNLIGQEEIWENLKKANAVARAWAWFQGALAGLLGFVRQIPTLAMNAFKALEITDLILVPRAFVKIAGVFGGFVVQFITWAGSTIWHLLEIIFEVVSPALLGYLRKTGEALKNILNNPIPFVRNLVRAAILGFQNFADNFGTHLKAGLINWLTGSLPGVYIPTAFTLGEIVKFVFSVLGLTWQNIRPKLVKVVGETAVKAMETGFDIVVTLVTKGPAAAWDKIQEHLSNLKDQVIGGITDFVVDTIVKKAVPKLIAMFIPGAGFISAIISIYDTIMVFVDKLAKIAAVVKSFVDSIVAIAGGAIDAAAKRVETTLAGLLSLAISFLAGFLGLGNIAEKIMGVITKIRATIDKAVDALIAWVVKMAKALFAKVFGKGDKPDERTDAQKQADLDKAVAEAEAAMGKDDADRDSVDHALKEIKAKYKLTRLDLVRDADDAESETDHVIAEINPSKTSKPKKFAKGMIECFALFTHKTYDEAEYRRQLVTAQKTIWKMKVVDWMSNREEFVERRQQTGSGRDPKSAELQEEFRKQVKSSWILKRAVELKKTMDAAKAAAQAAKDWEDQAALHPLDQVAGGGPKPTDMGDSAINSSIGSTWRTQVDAIYQVCAKISTANQKKWNMNVTIKLDGNPV
jgi:hypothetical protein